MIRLVDGPAEGGYAVKRAPLFLRAVVHRGTNAKDVLDQLADTPAPDELVSVYRRAGEAGAAIVCGRGPRAVSGTFATGEYHHMPEVDGEALRDNTAWQAWATEQGQAATA